MHAHTRYTQVPHNNRNDLNNLKTVVPLFREYFGRVAVALICLLLAKFAHVGVPVVFKEIVEILDLSKQSSIHLPIFLLVAYGVLRLAGSLFNELRDAIFAKVRYGAVRQLSTRLMEHLYKLSLRFHLERSTGAISRDLERGTRSVSNLLNYVTFNILPTIVEFILVATILLVNYEIKFTLITFITVLIYITFTFLISNWRMHYRHSMNQSDSEANSQAIDGLMNYETVKYFCNEKYEVDRYDKTLSEWEVSAVKSQTSMSTLNFGQASIIAIGVMFMMIYASQGVVDKTMTLGDLVLVNAFMLQLFLPLGFLGIIYRQSLYALADMDLLLKLFATKQEIEDKPNAKPLVLQKGLVKLENVSFYYQQERQILNNISFEVLPGKKIAVVGPSGSGKSTLVRLLFRYYDVIDGCISLDGQDIRDVTQQSLRSVIGIVPQDTVLFNNSILFNIAYAKLGASNSDIYQAARTAHIHDFIESLPSGYETIVGERGLKLSGGEKQRIAIARVVLSKAKILIFDEATSSLDSRSEQHILKSLNEVAENHTTLVIAHRLSTIIDADEILVMENGNIVERGQHDDLLINQHLYAQMWELQKKERNKNKTKK